MTSKPDVNSNEPEVTKPYFINDDKYQLLRQCQQEIYAGSEISPSIRKIVNSLITKENLHDVKMKFLSSFGSEK